MHTVNWDGTGALLGSVLRSVRKLLADIRGLKTISSEGADREAQRS